MLGKANLAGQSFLQSWNVTRVAQTRLPA